MTFADGEIEQVIVAEDQIAERVGELAAEIRRDYDGRCPLVIGVLTGSFVFLADLVRRIDMPLQVSFCAASSYGSSTESSGQVAACMDICEDVAGRDVVLVEDIIDTGRTVARIVEALRERRCASVEVCSLLDKPSRRVAHVEPRYVGFEIPDRFVVGYGLDFAGKYRHLPYVAALKPDAYQS
jgi:hypoxanthine phosphoribosyltransferase